MFDIGWGELLVIGIIALVVIGPKDLPAVVRTVGQTISKLRRMASDFQSQFQDAMREAELAELRKEAEKLTEVATSANPLNQFEKIGDDLQRALDTPSPAPGEGAGQMPPVAAAAPVVPPELEQPPTPTPEPEAKPKDGGP
jgi:sec-independent protein translocase protein TatB